MLGEDHIFETGKHLLLVVIDQPPDLEESLVVVDVQPVVVYRASCAENCQADFAVIGVFLLHGNHVLWQIIHYYLGGL